MFWNALMLPGITAISLGGAVMLRRGFGLESGTYDTALGLLNTILTHSALGLLFTVPQFVPGVARASGRSSVVRFVRRIAVARFALLLAVVAGINVYARPLADSLHLDGNGVWLVRTVSVLAVLRAGSDLAVDVLQSLLAHQLANLVQLAQAVALVVAVGWTLLAHASTAMLFTILTVAAAGTLAMSIWLARREVRAVPAAGAEPGAERPVPWSRTVGFAAFMYVNDASNYFATPAFASPALAAVLHGPATTALFNVAFQIPMMAVVLILSGFQGLYRPLFAGLMDAGEPDRVRTAFAEISKVQAALLIPAGAGLVVLLPQYVQMLFGSQFAAAVPLARILAVFMVAESLLNVGVIMLSVDKRYSMTLGVQLVRVVAAPVFIWLAIAGHLNLAAAAFGCGRFLTVALGYLLARRRYGVRFPMGFAARVSLATTLMVAAVVGAGLLMPSTWIVTLARTALGVVVLGLGLRWFAVLGPREQDLLSRARLPGSGLLVRWLAQRGPGRAAVGR
jgi:O-antigen/teichoic acid export membrane protein